MERADLIAQRPVLVAVGTNTTALWGTSSLERVRRIAATHGLAFVEAKEAAASTDVLLANLAFAFDPAWVSHLERLPATVLTLAGVPVLAHVGAGAREAVTAAMMAGCPLARADVTTLAAEDPAGIYNEALRKRERPFAEPLTPATVPLIERLSYKGAYKGVTDLLTLYLWPEWAFALTRLCARRGLSPNQVTAIGSLLCIVATALFWTGWFWSGLALGLVFMVLDTVDGKLARCTITSSKLGNAWDHGVDLVHPPFWWWAWAAGCTPYGRPLDDRTFWTVIGTMLFGYVAQRLIEGAFIVRLGMHIHVWRRFDSRFRLVTARRNPNMVILLFALLLARPDWGIEWVAGWTLVSLLVHLWRLIQAQFAPRPLTSWLA